jgi:hypothetical protein
MSKSKAMMITVLGGLLIIGTSCATLGATADEILDKMESVFAVDTGDTQGVLATMTMHNNYGNDVTSEYSLHMLEMTEIDTTQPEDLDETSHVLMYFAGGDEEGSIFLMETPENEDLDSRMWLYLPALGVTKELVSDEDQSGSFAGSSMSYGDLGNTSNLRDDYDAVIVGEESLDVDGATYMVWVLELSAKPGVDSDYSRVLIWVDQSDYLTLKMESYGNLGALESEMTFLVIGKFEGDPIPEVIRSVDHAEGTVSTITISNLRRPDAPLTVTLYDPSALNAFDPAAYGF